MQQRTEKRLAVLLAVYNGARYLPAQLATLRQQTGLERLSSFDVWASVDGSADGSVEILEAAAKEWGAGSFRIRNGPEKGFAENFRFLLTLAEIDADYFAFCDQDDIWDADKLSVALDWLGNQDSMIPALYCSRTRTINPDGKDAGFSPLFSRKPSFRNAIVQSIAGGNTMVMNKAAHRIVAEASRRSGFVSHDWWCYLLVTGAGGIVHYDRVARIGYRQHEGNLVGENNSWAARLDRLKRLLGGGFSAWNDRNMAGLKANADLLKPAALETMRLVESARHDPLPGRLSSLMKSGAYRQTLFGQIGLYAACLLKKL